jgi:hypothetical protein
MGKTCLLLRSGMHVSALYLKTDYLQRLVKNIFLILFFPSSSTFNNFLLAQRTLFVVNCRVDFIKLYQAENGGDDAPDTI